MTRRWFYGAASAALLVAGCPADSGHDPVGGLQPSDAGVGVDTGASADVRDRPDTAQDCSFCGVPPENGSVTCEARKCVLTCGSSVVACDDTCDKVDDHCGRCDHSCGGRGCKGGACAKIFVSATDVIRQVDVVGGDLYTVQAPVPGNGRQIKKCATPDCAITSIVQDTGSVGVGIVGRVQYDTTYVYWSGATGTASHGLNRTRLSDGQRTVLANWDASNPFDPTFAVSGNDVFIATRSIQPELKTCTATQPPCNFSPLSVSVGDVSSLFVTPTELAWLDVGAASSGVFRCDRASCAGSKSEIVGAAAMGKPGAASLFEGTLYWADAAARILACPLTGCSGQPTVMVDGESDISAFAVDSQGIFFITNPPTLSPTGVGKVCRNPTGCGTSSELLANEIRAELIALDATWAFIDQTDSLAQSLMRFEKQ